MYRKGVSAIIVNRNEEILLVNLVSFEDRYFAIPGGGLEVGEELLDATYREIKEELGIDKKSLRYAGKSENPLNFKFKVIKINREGEEYEGSERYFFGFVFIGNYDEIKPQENEIRTYKWSSFKDLDKYLLFDNQLKETSEKILEIFPYLK